MAFGFMIAVMCVEVAYRLAALPPADLPVQQPADLQVQQDVASPAIATPAAVEPVSTSALTISRQLALPPVRSARELSLAHPPIVRAAGSRLVSGTAVVALAPGDVTAGLRLNLQLHTAQARSVTVFSTAPAAGPAIADAGQLDTTPAATGGPEGSVPGQLDALPVGLPVAPWPPPAARPGAARPLIAIVIDDMGYSRAALTRLATMPGPLTLSFLPYAHATPTMLEAARGRDLELLLHLPMEPLGDADPGPEALLVGLEEVELRRRVRWALDQVPGVVGVNNHMGSRFTTDARGLEVVMDELRRDRLFFVDSRTNPASQAERIAGAAGIPTTGRDIFIDHDPTPSAIARQFAAIERFARYTGTVIAIGHPYPTTLAALEAWLPTVTERGFRLARLSEVLAKRLCAQPQQVVEPCGPAVHLVGSEASPFEVAPVGATP